MARAAARLFARLERRHWTGLGASAALHLAVFLGWLVTPEPEPESVSFEVSFDPPDNAALATVPPATRPVPAKRIARKNRPKSLVSEPMPDESVQREAHLLDANWRAEQTSARDAPALALPDAQSLGIPFDTAQIVRTQPPAKSLAASAAPPAAEASQPNNAGGAELVEPQAAPVAGQHGQPADAGLALTHTAILSASRNLDTSIAGAGAQASSTLPSPSAAAVAGVGDVRAELNAAATAQTARNVTVGTGSQAAADSAVAVRAAASRAEAPGLRLTASGGLASGPVSSTGEGARVAQPHAAMLAVGDAHSGSAPSALQASADDSATGVHSAANRSGSALSSLADSGASRAGHAPPTGGGLVAATAAPNPAISGIRVSGRAGSSGQGAATVALKPGEPGSRPNLAVAMQPVVASAPGAKEAGGGRNAGAGQSAASRQPDVSIGHAKPAVGGSVSGDASLPQFSGVNAKNAAVSGGLPGKISRVGETTGDQLAASRVAASVALQEAARESGRAPMVLQAIQPVAVKVVRPDSEIQRLDVLAPSNYCPLPLPGHEQPDNRAPLPERRIVEQPAYAADNPSIHYPVLANIRGVEGRVTVRVEVLSDGRPGKMWLKQSSGSGILDQDALAQLKTWRYQPARRNGQPVSAWIDVPVLYRLSQAR